DDDDDLEDDNDDIDDDDDLDDDGNGLDDDLEDDIDDDDDLGGDDDVDLGGDDDDDGDYDLDGDDYDDLGGDDDLDDVDLRSSKYMNDQFKQEVSKEESIAQTTKLNNEYGYICECSKIPYDFIIKNGIAPGVGIVQTVEDHHVDLIVMGNRGLSRLKRTLLG
ncbi:uncharacterized protein DC041_0000985, partial [Schistosoma bovis]